MSERCKPASMGRIAKQGGAAVAGSLLLLGMGGGVASAHTHPNVAHTHPNAAPTHQDVSPNGGDKQQLQHSDKGGGSQSNSLIDLSHNQIPIQICHNQIPVNVLGVQVPISDVDANLGLLGGSEAKANQDASCHQPAAQQN